MTFTPLVLVDAYVLINGSVYSDHGNKVGVNVEYEDLDATTFGQSAHVRRAGLQDGTIDISFLNDFTAANIDASFWAIIATVVTFEIRPTSGSRSTGNPAYLGNILINKWTPVTGDVGKIVQVDCSFPTSGLTTRVTS
jgi:hypothetical protein